ncbi:unnamed protein product [Dicrocoelium dendriticum]|nr:unnamed protein product [Dicrocoelium dendriticum]
MPSWSLSVTSHGLSCLGQFRNLFLLSFTDVGKKSPTFEDAAMIADALLRSDVKFTRAIMSIVSYIPTPQNLLNVEEIPSAPKITQALKEAGRQASNQARIELLWTPRRKMPVICWTN